MGLETTISSGLFFVPTIIAFFRQSFLITIIFFNAALFSTLYHASNEENYEELDVMWANLAVLCSLIILVIVSKRYSPWNWRVLVPTIFGLGAFGLYFGYGRAPETTNTELDNEYNLFHSLWHVLISISGMFVAWQTCDLSEINSTFASMYGKYLPGFDHEGNPVKKKK